MDRLVFYHHPQAENFSLKFSSASLADIRSQRKQSDELTKLIGYPFETPVYVLYEGDTEIESAQDIGRVAKSFRILNSALIRKQTPLLMVQ